MSKVMKKLANQLLRKARARAKVHGTEARPRLSVYVSNMHIHAQIVNDDKSITVASSTSATAKDLKGSLSEKAAWVGADIAKKAKKAKVTAVVFDRGGRQYHGRLKALAEAARAGGLEF